MKHHLIHVILAALVWASFPSAATATSSPTFQFGATPSLIMSVNHFCSRDYDVVECSNGFFGMGFQVDANVQFPFQWFALGMIGGMNFEMNQVESCTERGCQSVQNVLLWRVGVDARFYPLIRDRALLFLAIEGGVVGSGGRAFTDVAPEVGGGLGVDFPIGRFFFIGLDIRALFFAFGPETVSTPDGDKLNLTHSFWVNQGFLKLGARFSL